MIIRAGFDIAFELPQPTPMILMLSVHPSRAKDVLTDPRIRVSPSVVPHNYRDTFGNQYACHGARGARRILELF
jgi:hypothetical protein